MPDQSVADVPQRRLRFDVPLVPPSRNHSPPAPPPGYSHTVSCASVLISWAYRAFAERAEKPQAHVIGDLGSRFMRSAQRVDGMGHCRNVAQAQRSDGQVGPLDRPGAACVQSGLVDVGYLQSFPVTTVPKPCASSGSGPRIFATTSRRTSHARPREFRPLGNVSRSAMIPKFR